MGYQETEGCEERLESVERGTKGSMAVVRLDEGRREDTGDTEPTVG